MSDLRTVVLVGKLGHGKTRILNKACGTEFRSESSSRSCTKTLQFAQTLRYRIRMIDTPGFYSSEEVARHIEEQKCALEGCAISGTYVVVKYGRIDEMIEALNKIMDFVGDDDVRVILTFTDVAQQQQGYDIQETKSQLSQLLDVCPSNIAEFGKDTDAETIEDFIHSTLHSPKQFAVSQDQLAYMSSINVGVRRFNSLFEEANGKIEAALLACKSISKHGNSRATNIVEIATRKATCREVKNAREKVFGQAKDLTAEEQRILGSKCALLLQRQQDFMEAHERDTSTDRLPALTVQFLGQELSWLVQYRLSGVPISLEDLLCKLNEKRRPTMSTPKVGRRKKRRAARRIEQTTKRIALACSQKENSSAHPPSVRRESTENKNVKSNEGAGRKVVHDRVGRMCFTQRWTRNFKSTSTLFSCFVVVLVSAIATAVLISSQ